MSLNGIPGMGCPCQGPSGMSGFGLGTWVSGGGQIVVNTDNGVQGFSFNPHNAGDVVDGSEVSVVAGQGGAGATAMETAYPGSSSSGISFSDIGKQALSVPGEVTGAFGLTPAQALQLGLTLGGRPQMLHAPPPAPAPSSGIGLGTGLFLGGLAIGGLAWAATRKPATHAA